MIQMDIRGQVCPNVTGSVYPKLRRLPPGETLEITSDYPPARFTIPDLAKQFGGTCSIRELGDGQFVIEIRKTSETAATA